MSSTTLLESQTRSCMQYSQTHDGCGAPEFLCATVLNSEPCGVRELWKSVACVRVWRPLSPKSQRFSSRLTSRLLQKIVDQSRRYPDKSRRLTSRLIQKTLRSGWKADQSTTPWTSRLVGFVLIQGVVFGAYFLDLFGGFELGLAQALFKSYNRVRIDVLNSIKG